MYIYIIIIIKYLCFTTSGALAVQVHFIHFSSIGDKGHLTQCPREGRLESLSGTALPSEDEL